MASLDSLKIDNNESCSSEPKIRRVKRTFKTKATVYHDVLQRTKEWHDLRRGRLSGSQVGTAVGISKYMSPIDYFLQQIQPDLVFVSNAACEHGVRTEPLSTEFIQRCIFPNLHRYFSCFRLNMKQMDLPSPELVKLWQSQVYSQEPGYHTPKPEQNPNFPHKEDAKLCGLSLDMEGSFIDVEIKNPFAIKSFWNNYHRVISPLYFAQVQWSMAMRCRKRMFLIATSYTTEKKPRLMAYVVWMVNFSKKFFRNFLYPKAKLMIQTIRGGNAEDVSVIEERIPFLCTEEDYQDSVEYKKIFEKYCFRIHTEKYENTIQDFIQNKN